MRLGPVLHGRFRPELRALPIAVALWLTTAPVAFGAAPAAPLQTTLLAEFTAICTELTEARSLLANGRLTDEAFTEAILDLFARADSLASILRSRPGARSDIRLFALERGTAYLIDALRENYVGIVARNGVSFAEADLALKAAVAWRSGARESSVAVP